MPRRRESWWDRNWPWVLGGGCLLPAVLVACCVGGGLFSFGRFARGDFGPQEAALERARSHPAVIDALGEPIEAGWPKDFSVRIGDEGSTADITLPLTGPKGSGLLEVEAHRADEDWLFDRLELELEGSDASIDLLAPDAAPSSAVREG